MLPKKAWKQVVQDSTAFYENRNDFEGFGRAFQERLDTTVFCATHNTESAGFGRALQKCGFGRAFWQKWGFGRALRTEFKIWPWLPNKKSGEALFTVFHWELSAKQALDGPAKTQPAPTIMTPKMPPKCLPKRRLEAAFEKYP